MAEQEQKKPNILVITIFSFASAQSEKP